MNRRVLIQKAALLGFAVGAGSIGGLERVRALSTPGKPSVSGSVPSTASPAGALPVALVLGQDAVELDFAGPYQVFSGARSREGDPLFAPYTVAAAKTPVTTGGGMKILPDHDFASAPKPKLIVIPAMEFSDQDTAMFDWIGAASQEADITMSVCNGAFLLARTGLLDGKAATCHHAGYFEFAATYPKVRLERGARFVEADKIASAGGISSGIDLALRVVERYAGQELAAHVADGMEYQGKGWLDPRSNEVYARMPAMSDAHPICAVCYMNAERSINTRHEQKTLYFCSSDHKKTFERHTDVYDRFAAEDARGGSRIGWRTPGYPLA